MTEAPDGAMALLQLMQLASPGLPVGGFSCSEGLEAAVDSSRVRDETEAGDWLLGPDADIAARPVALESAVPTSDSGVSSMGMMSFLKEAGEKLFGKGEAKAAQAAAAAAPSPEAIAALNATAGKAIADYVATQGLAVGGLDISFDGATSTVTVAGVVGDQATKEKVLLCCGNVAGVAAVNDLLTVNEPAPEAQWHTVVSGDNLSKIAKKFYGDANKYPAIFEANKPMLTHPDKIYPGQMLRIPPA